MKKTKPAKLREQAQELIEKADQIEAEYFVKLGQVFLHHLQRDKELKDVDTLKESVKKILERLGYDA